MRIYLFRFYYYIRHLFISQTRFGIHSPFVWRFYHEVLHSKITPRKFSLIENKRKLLLKDASGIVHLDKGTSSSNVSKEIRVKDKIGRAHV